MGCESGRDEERPVHRVSVNSFDLAVLAVTNRDWLRFRPEHHAPPGFDHPDQPVVSVSWLDAVAYCGWLGPEYRLPTEAEWEWAARGGSEGLLYVWGNEAPASRQDYQRRWSGDVRAPRPVGEEPPNPYGIHDIGENIHEWCADWYDPRYYECSPEHDPRGPEQGVRKASRGGSWRHHIKVSRVAARSSIPPDFRYADYGFRVVREATNEHE